MQSSQFTEWLEKIRQDNRLNDVQRGLLNSNFIRTINYHATGLADAARFERDIASYARHFSSVTVADLDRFIENGQWHKDKPGLILGIFEGFRNHYDVIWPILEKYGLVGWFHIPAFFIDRPAGDQLEWAEAHELHITRPEEYTDGRYAMNREEVREIARNHVISCHSGSHFQIMKDTSDADMKREIVDAKICLESMTDKPIELFCWLYGEEYAWNPRAASYIEAAGYRYVIGNLKLEKINVTKSIALE